MSERVKGATSVSLLFRLTDATTGAAKTGLDVTTLKLQYARPGAAASTATSLTLLAAQTTSWTAYGAIEVDNVNSKGIYRMDCPDAAFATGADEVTLSVSGTLIETSTRLIDLTGFNARDAVRGGLTALPNAAAGANAGLPLGDGSGRVVLQPTGLDAVSIADVTNDTDARSTLPKMIRAVFNRHFNKVTATASQLQVFNDANSAAQTLTVSDDGTTATKGKSS